jgi:hypothetical protein
MKALGEERDEMMRVMNPRNHFDVNSCVIFTFFYASSILLREVGSKTRNFIPMRNIISRMQTQGSNFCLLTQGKRT